MTRATIGVVLMCLVMVFCVLTSRADDQREAGKDRIERLKRHLEEQLKEQLPDGARIELRVVGEGEKKPTPKAEDKDTEKERVGPKLDDRGARLAAGFGEADANSDGEVSKKEMKTYVSGKIPDFDKHDDLFRKLDEDESESLSKEEFAKRFEAIAELQGVARRPQPAEGKKPTEEEKKKGTGFDDLRKSLKAKGLPDQAIDQVIEKLKERGIKELPKGARIEIRGAGDKLPRDNKGRPEI